MSSTEFAFSSSLPEMLTQRYVNFSTFATVTKKKMHRSQFQFNTIKSINSSSNKIKSLVDTASKCSRHPKKTSSVRDSVLRLKKIPCTPLMPQKVRSVMTRNLRYVPQQLYLLVESLPCQLVTLFLNNTKSSIDLTRFSVINTL